jgi:hypothetical protein
VLREIRRFMLDAGDAVRIIREALDLYRRLRRGELRG